MAKTLTRSSSRVTEQVLVDFARDALEGLVPSGWRVESTLEEARGPRTPDAVISLKDAAGERVLLFIEAKSRATPTDLANWAEATADRAPWLVVAPALSARSKDVLRKADVNWLDTTGSVSLRLPRMLIEIDSLASRSQSDGLFAAGRSLVMPYAIEEDDSSRFVAEPFAGDALRIVRQLLLDPTREWRVTEMARVTGVSKGWVSRLFATLERDAYISGPPRGSRRLVDPNGLLDAWAEADSPLHPQLRAVTTESLEQLRERVAALPDRAYALTGDAAADLVAPFARVSVIELYIAPDELRGRGTLKKLRARETTRGANVVLRAAHDSSMLEDGETIDSPYGSLRIVSRPQLYVDLRRSGGPSRKAAEFLKDRNAIWPRKR